MTIQTGSSEELDRRIRDAAEGAVVVWRGERLHFLGLPDRIARIDDRGERDGLFLAYQDALEALNPLYRARLGEWVASDPIAAATDKGADPRRLAVELERFSLNSETPYYAALRRYLALINIEQGDATVADMWHVARGGAWTHWFSEREANAAAAAAGRPNRAGAGLDGWRAAESVLAGEPAGRDPLVAAAVSQTYASLVGDPAWLRDELRVASDEVALLTDFLAFVRLWRLRTALGDLQYELRLYTAEQDPGIQRAYYHGILGHITGLGVPEAAYLHAISSPLDSARRLRAGILASMLVETQTARFGEHWWREDGAVELARALGDAANLDDALAQLGYDDLDWRPVLRQIRTRLIGEMSGYGGPNITTRAGTRKV